MRNFRDGKDTVHGAQYRFFNQLVINQYQARISFLEGLNDAARIIDLNCVWAEGLVEDGDLLGMDATFAGEARGRRTLRLLFEAGHVV